MNGANSVGARILFFDDLGLSEGNELFILRLKRKTGIEVELVRTVKEFEAKIHSDSWTAIVLDIMAQPPSDYLVLGSDPPLPVKAAQAGLELLKRCRLGHYGDSIKALPIYMRTARGEEHIKRKAKVLGATDYFDAVGRDKDLIQKIGDLVKSVQDNP
jgi:CheY-like chemotaxis protein